MIPRIFMSSDDTLTGGLGPIKRDKPASDSKPDPNDTFRFGNKPQPNGMPTPVVKREPLPPPERAKGKEDIEVTVWTPDEPKAAGFDREISGMETRTFNGRLIYRGPCMMPIVGAMSREDVLKLEGLPSSQPPLPIGAILSRASRRAVKRGADWHAVEALQDEIDKEYGSPGRVPRHLVSHYIAKFDAIREAEPTSITATKLTDPPGSGVCGISEAESIAYLLAHSFRMSAQENTDYSTMTIREARARLGLDGKTLDDCGPSFPCSIDFSKEPVLPPDQKLKAGMLLGALGAMAGYFAGAPADAQPGFSLGAATSSCLGPSQKVKGPALGKPLLPSDVARAYVGPVFVFDEQTPQGRLVK